MNQCPRLAAASLLLGAVVASAACHEEGRIQVASLSFKGVHAVDESRLRAVLATREGSWPPWGKKPYFDRARFMEDLKRIEAFYADRGYPDARVASFNVKLNDRQDGVALTVVVSEGAPVLVDAVRFEGFEAMPRDHLDRVRARAPLRAGEPLDRQLLQSTRDLAVDELKDHGYPYARVAVSEVPAAVAQRTTVVFTAVPGVRAYFGPIEIAGNKSVGDDVIRRQLTFRPGDLFQLSEVRASQRKLDSLELFQLVNVEIVDLNLQSSEVRTRVTVAEGKHHRLAFGVGYGTEEKARGEAEWRHLNFLGGARRAGVHGKWSSLDRGVKFDFGEPYFLHPNLSLGLDVRRWYDNEPAFTLDSTGGKVTLTRRTISQGALSPGRPLLSGHANYTLSISLLGEFERNTISKEALNDPSLRNELIALHLDPRSGRRSGTLSALAFDGERNTTTTRLNATSGSVLAIHLEQAGHFLPGTYRYDAIGGEARHYLPVANRFVVATRVQFGTIDGKNEASVPFFKRFFLGGATSVRGWGRFEVSPLSGAGLPIGGQTMFEGTSEVRVPLAGNLGGVVFLDAGNVWSGAWDVRLGDLRYAAGPGLRYMTPIGPVRLDFGYQLTPIKGLLVKGRPQTRRWRIHFSIGQAF